MRAFKAAALALLIASSASAQTVESVRKQGLRDCLNEAQIAYERDRHSRCPGGAMFPCRLSTHEEMSARTALIEERSNCYSANGAGLFTPEPIDMRPKP